MKEKIRGVGSRGTTVMQLYVTPLSPLIVLLFGQLLENGRTCEIFGNHYYLPLKVKSTISKVYCTFFHF